MQFTQNFQINLEVTFEMPAFDAADQKEAMHFSIADLKKSEAQYPQMEEVDDNLTENDCDMMKFCPISCISEKLNDSGNIEKVQDFEGDGLELKLENPDITSNFDHEEADPQIKFEIENCK